MRAYSVFEKFFERSNPEKGFGVLSKECFEMWLETRSRKPKFPQESFKRVVLAHVRGVDNRRPFPEKVEAAILFYIRSKGSLELNPWLHLYTESEAKLHRTQIVKKWTRQNMCYGFHEKSTFKTVSIITKDLMEALLDLSNPDITLLQRSAGVGKLDLLCPSVIYLLAKYSETDPRFSPSFIQIAEEDRFGRPDLETYRMVCDQKSCLCEEFPAEFGEDIGNVPENYHKSILEYLIGMMLYMKDLDPSKPYWNRARMVFHGKTYIFHMRTTFVEDKVVTIFQDRTLEWKMKDKVYLS